MLTDCLACNARADKADGAMSGSHYSLVAVKSEDNGKSWKWLSTVASHLTPNSPKECLMPSESSTVYFLRQISFFSDPFCIGFLCCSNADQGFHFPELAKVPQERLSFHGVSLRWRRTAVVFHAFERRRKDMEHSGSHDECGWCGAQTVCLAEPRRLERPL